MGGVAKSIVKTIGKISGNNFLEDIGTGKRNIVGKKVEPEIVETQAATTAAAKTAMGMAEEIREDKIDDEEKKKQKTSKGKLKVKLATEAKGVGINTDSGSGIKI